MKTSIGYPTKLAGLCKSVDNYTHILVESMLYDLRASMNVRILDAGKYARFCMCDDKIFDSYLRLIRNYKSTLVLYENKADVLISPQLKNIMQGIEAVIRARLGSCPEEITGDMAENSVFIIKKRLINDEITKFNEIFDAS